MTGNTIPVLPRLIPHRTWTHSLWLAALLFLLWPPLGVGVAAHLLADVLTRDGLTPLWPCPPRIRLPLSVRTGGIVDHLLGAVCWLLIAALLWRRFQGVVT